MEREGIVVYADNDSIPGISNPRPNERYRNPQLKRSEKVSPRTLPTGFEYKCFMPDLRDRPPLIARGKVILSCHYGLEEGLANSQLIQ